MTDIDHERFTRCWTQAQPAIASFLGAVLRDADAADDALQNVAVALLRKFADYDAGRPFAAWAMGVAKIEVLRLRQRAARAPVALPDDMVEAMADACAEVEAELDPRQRALGECLAGVRGRAVDLIRLRYAEDLAPAAIAGRLGVTAGNVRIMLHRLRAGLQACVERRLEAGRRSP